MLEEGSDEPYATLFSKDDLTLNGSGSLSVTSSYRHAICSKDDLVITGGTYVIDAAEDALRGRDCVKICDGEFTVTAAGDGIKSNNDEDATRGFVSIDGGSFSIEAGDDGIQAVTYLHTTGGTMTIESTDDALHSDGEALIAGGTLTIETGDDAVHAETVLTVDDGTVDVISCYEGYEAEKVYINGSVTHIVADDDALNAAAAGTDTSEEASGESANERMREGGVPQGGMMEGGGMGAGDENCLIQVNGGYIVLDAAGDGVDSNGSIEINGGVLLVSGPASGDNGALDYDLSATVTGGTVIAVGSMQMAQNFTDGTQAFAYATVSGSAGDSIAVTAEDGTVLCSFTSTKQFSSVVVTCPQFSEGGSYSLVIGGVVEGANENGYADAGSVSGGSSTSITASTTASGGMGGLGADGNGMPAGQPGDIRQGQRGGMGQPMDAPEGGAPTDMSDSGAPEGMPEGTPPRHAVALTKKRSGLPLGMGKARSRAVIHPNPPRAPPIARAYAGARCTRRNRLPQPRQRGQEPQGRSHRRSCSGPTPQSRLRSQRPCLQCRPHYRKKAERRS